MELGKYILYIHKKLSGSLDVQEKEVLEEWLRDGDNSDMEKDLNKIWNASKQYKSSYQPDVDRSWQGFASKLSAEKAEASSSNLRVIRRPILSVAASLIFILCLSVLWRSISFSTDKLQEIVTVKGETKEVILPDGSTVVLNENSHLSFSSSWEEKNTRQINFTGEAFFQITPNPDQPFQIISNKAKVTVLGTAFNFRIYPLESFAEVAVTEGLVSLAKLDESAELQLAEGQVGRLEYAHNTLNEINFSAANAQSWRTNVLSFHKTPMPEMTEALERHFEVDIRFSDICISRYTYNSDFTGESLQTILETLELALGLRVERTGESSYLLSAECEF